MAGSISHFPSPDPSTHVPPQEPAKVDPSTLPAEIISNIGKNLDPLSCVNAMRTKHAMASALYHELRIKQAEWLRNHDDFDLHLVSRSKDREVINKYNRLIEVATNTNNKKITDGDRVGVLRRYCLSPVARANPETLFNVADLIESDKEKENAAFFLNVLGCQPEIRQQCFGRLMNFITGIRDEAARIRTIPEFWRHITRAMAVIDVPDDEIAQYLPQILALTDNLQDIAVISQAAETLAELAVSAQPPAHVQDAIGARVNQLRARAIADSDVPPEV